jgi:general secretion pathway protein G
MKIKLITLIVVVLISACSKEIELKQLQTRGNLVYEVNATSPFTGTVKEQYDNGQVKLKSTYKKGEKNGTHVEYYENGELKFNAKYESGQLEGKYEEYYPNQILKKSGELVKGTGSEFHFTRSSELYKTISYENHIVTYEKYEDINDSYIEMIELSGVRFPQDDNWKTNFNFNLNQNPAISLDFLLFSNAEDNCFSFDNEVTKYKNGNLRCSIIENKSQYFYPNGSILAKSTNIDGVITEEVFNVSGKSCGQQKITGNGEEHFIYHFPDCSINYENWRRDGKVYQTKTHNRTPQRDFKNGYFYCKDGDGDLIYSGTDINCEKGNDFGGYSSIPKLSNKTKNQQTIRIISNALKFFRLDNFRYPTNEEGLMALVSAPAGLSEWNGPYLDAVPKDAWNRPFLYSYPGDNGKEFDVYTLGADGIKDGENDDRDWGNWNF